MSKKKIIEILLDKNKYKSIYKTLQTIGVHPGAIVELMDNVINIDESKPNGIIIVTQSENYFINNDIARCIIWENADD